MPAPTLEQLGDFDWWRQHAPYDATHIHIYPDGTSQWMKENKSGAFNHYWHQRFSEWQRLESPSLGRTVERPGPKPRIVCAANRNQAGTILLGVRHWDSFMNDHRVFVDAFSPNNGFKWEQGFVDQFGNFYNRKEAWVIAEENGQIIRQVSTPGILFSENLY